MTEEQRLDLIAYRMESAHRLLIEIESHIQNGFYNTAVNRMYYACFYAVSALLLSESLDGVKTHDGARNMLGLYFVKTDKLSKELGRFYSLLFSRRDSADYGVFIDYDKQAVDELYPKTIEFVSAIDHLLQDKY